MNTGDSNTNQLANNPFKIKVDIEKTTIKKGEELNVNLSLVNQTNSRFSLQYVDRLTHVKILDSTGKELFIRGRFLVEQKIIVGPKETVQPDPSWKVIMDHPGEYEVIGYSEFTISDNDKVIIEAPPKIIRVVD